MRVKIIDNFITLASDVSQLNTPHPSPPHLQHFSQFQASSASAAQHNISSITIHHRCCVVPPALCEFSEVHTIYFMSQLAFLNM